MQQSNDALRRQSQIAAKHVQHFHLESELAKIRQMLEARKSEERARGHCAAHMNENQEFDAQKIQRQAKKLLTHASKGTASILRQDPRAGLQQVPGPSNSQLDEMSKQIERVIQKKNASAARPSYTPSAMLQALAPIQAHERIVGDKYLQIKEQWLLDRYFLQK